MGTIIRVFSCIGNITTHRFRCVRQFIHGSDTWHFAALHNMLIQLVFLYIYLFVHYYIGLVCGWFGECWVRISVPGFLFSSLINWLAKQILYMKAQ